MCCVRLVQIVAGRPHFRPHTSFHTLRGMGSKPESAMPGMTTRAEQMVGHPAGPDTSGHTLAQTINRAAAMAGEAVIGDKVARPLGSGGGPAVSGSGTPASPGRHAPSIDLHGTGERRTSTAAATSGHGTTTYACPRGLIGVADEQGKRSYMEDRHTAIPDFALPGGRSADGLPRQFVAVYDGHSSHHGSEHASRRLHEFIASQPAIQQCTGSAEEAADVQAALKSAFEDVDQEIVEVAVQGGKRYGTTAVCALRVGNTIYIAHAGDSKAVLCRGGKAIALTRDHKPASVPQERERIEAQGGRIAYEADRVLSNPEGQRQSRLNMSRALGDPDFKSPRRLVEAEPDVARVELRAGADRFLLLGSDGLFDVMNPQQAVDLACRELDASGTAITGDSAEAAADALVRQALKAGTSDNVTAIVQLFDWDRA